MQTIESISNRLASIDCFIFACKRKQMNVSLRSLRPFIGSVDFQICKNFYIDLGFEENILSENLSVFKKGGTAFYLQNAYVKDWVDNTMLFAEVENLDDYHQFLSDLNLSDKYARVRLSSIKVFDWGREFYLHDPSGILWHFGVFNQ